MKTAIPSTITVELSLTELYHITESLCSAYAMLKIKTPNDNEHALRIERDLLQLEQVAMNIGSSYRQLLLTREGK